MIDLEGYDMVTDDKLPMEFTVGDGKFTLGVGLVTERPHVLTVDVAAMSWGYVLHHASGHILLPFLLIASRLFRKQIEW